MKQRIMGKEEPRLVVENTTIGESIFSLIIYIV